VSKPLRARARDSEGLASLSESLSESSSESRPPACVRHNARDAAAPATSLCSSLRLWLWGITGPSRLRLASDVSMLESPSRGLRLVQIVYE
jgi:hypothetical protein